MSDERSSSHHLPPVASNIHTAATSATHSPSISHQREPYRWLSSTSNLPIPYIPIQLLPYPSRSVLASPGPVVFDLSNKKKEPKQMSIDLTASTQKNNKSSLKRSKQQVNVQPKISKRVNSATNNIIREVNNIEDMLEKMFCTDESENPPVIKSVERDQSTSPTTITAEYVEKMLTSPPYKPRKEHDKSEDPIQTKNSPKKKGHITSNSSNSITDQQVVTENKLEPIIRPKQRNTRKKKKTETVKQDQSTLPTTINAEYVEKMLTSPPYKPRKEHDKSEDPIQTKNSPKKKGHITSNSSNSTTDQQVVTENKLEPIIRPKQRNTRKKKKTETVKQDQSTSPTTINAEYVEKMLTSPPYKPRKEHDKSEDPIQTENSPKKNDHITSNSSNSTTDQQVVTENKLEPIICPKQRNTKKKKQTETVKQNPPKPEKPKPKQKPKPKPAIEKPKPAIEKPKSKAAIEKANKNKGPVIRVYGGSIENPTSFSIINRHDKDDEDPNDCNINRNAPTYKSGLYNGEDKPDESNIERSSDWLCVYCSRGPNVRNIGNDPTGDLFGPYYVGIPKVDDTNGGQKPKKSKRNSIDRDTSERFMEIWIHENCLVWAPGVYMVGPKLHGIEDSVRIAIKTVCVYCGVIGAAIGCTAHKCKSTVHYSCAVHVGWLLDVETFRTTCNVHRKPLPSTSRQ